MTRSVLAMAAFLLRARLALLAGYQAARNFANSPQGWLTLCGGTGSGKTHLAVAIAREQLLKGNPVMFASVPELMDRLRHAYEPDSGVSYMRLLEDVKNAPILILDDLGRERRFRLGAGNGLSDTSPPGQSTVCPQLLHPRTTSARTLDR